jgi:hypothetical protein
VRWERRRSRIEEQFGQLARRLAQCSRLLDDRWAAEPGKDAGKHPEVVHRGPQPDVRRGFLQPGQPGRAPPLRLGHKESPVMDDRNTVGCVMRCGDTIIYITDVAATLEFYERAPLPPPLCSRPQR